MRDYLMCYVTTALFHSRLESETAGASRETVGSVSGHQQRERHDNIKLLLGPHGHTLLAMYVQSKRHFISFASQTSTYP